MTIAAAFILVFFTVYAASYFVTVGKLFSTIFGFNYQYATIWCAVSLFAAVAIGLIGRAAYPEALLTKSDAENIFSHP